METPERVAVETDVSASTPRSSGAPGRRALLVVFVGLNLGMLLSTLDGTIVATALPSIVRDLGGVSGITWVVTSYLLAQVASMPLYGKLGDVYGRKRVFMVAIALFTTGSMLCGAAQSMGQLLAARSVQGLGAGGLATLAMAIIADLVPPRQLGRWLGYQGAIFAVGGVAGPLAGGLFVDQLSWRWAFYATVPLAVVAIAMVGLTLRVPYHRIPHTIDYLGSALLTGAVVALVVLATVAGKDVAWLSPATVALAAAVVALTYAFVRRERRVEEPFVPVRLLTNPVVRASGGLNFTSGLVFYCAIFFVPVFLQDVAGVSPTASGLLLIPLMSATALATLLAGRRVERTGRYRIWPILGSLCMGAGVALLATMGRGTPIAVASAFGAVVGTGVGFVMQTSLLALQNRVDPGELGIATSTALLARTLGGTIGTSVFGAVLAAGLHTAHPHAADYAAALPAVFVVAIPFAVLSLVAAMRLEEHPLGEHARFALDVAT